MLLPYSKILLKVAAQVYALVCLPGYELALKTLNVFSKIYIHNGHQASTDLQQKVHDCRQAESIDTYTPILKGVLDQSNEQTAAGLAFHLADIFVPELLNVLKEEGQQLPDSAFQQLLGMFVEEMANSSRASLPPRIR